jgi:hypothetical protein
MRREVLYLTDIVEAADHIAAFILGVDFEGFQRSEKSGRKKSGTEEIRGEIRDRRTFIIFPFGENPRNARLSLFPPVSSLARSPTDG